MSGFCKSGHILYSRKVQQINRSANRLLIVNTNLDGLIQLITDDLPNSSNFPDIWYCIKECHCEGTTTDCQRACLQLPSVQVLLSDIMKYYHFIDTWLTLTNIVYQFCVTSKPMEGCSLYRLPIYGSGYMGAAQPAEIHDTMVTTWLFWTTT